MEVKDYTCGNTFRGLGTTRALRKICFDLMDKGISKRKIDSYCEFAGFTGIPGSLGHRYIQAVKVVGVLGFGVLGSYLGSKIDNPGPVLEVVGGLVGLCFGLHGLAATEAEEMHKPLIQSLIDNHPGELKEVYLENGFSRNEIEEIFSRERYQQFDEGDDCCAGL